MPFERFSTISSTSLPVVILLRTCVAIVAFFRRVVTSFFVVFLFGGFLFSSSFLSAWKSCSQNYLAFRPESLRILPRVLRSLTYCCFSVVLRLCSFLQIPSLSNLKKTPKIVALRDGKSAEPENRLCRQFLS